LSKTYVALALVHSIGQTCATQNEIEAEGEWWASATSTATHPYCSLPPALNTN